MVRLAFKRSSDQSAVTCGLGEAAERELRGLAHRYVEVVDDALGAAVAPELAAEGYAHEIIVTMVHFSLATLRPAIIIRDWRANLPDADDEQFAQLADRTALSSRGADLVLLAVFDGREIAAHAELYLDRAAGLAQSERLCTHAEFRGRGYATALVLDALRRGREAGCDLSFLTAGLDDWPREWYQRLGYRDAARTHHFDRA